MSVVRDTMEGFLVRATGGRVVIDVLYPLAVVPTGCSCEVEDMLFEVFGIWPSVS